MRFNLVDRIVEVELGRRIRTLKYLTLGEEYLADHFPTFPVMPGVLLLQTIVEAGAWLLRMTEDFRHSIIVLREARNVKYGSFLDPGRVLSVTAELVEPFNSSGGGPATLKGKGEVDGNTIVSAKVVLQRYNLCDRSQALKAMDERLVQHWKAQLPLLRGELQGCGQ